MIKIFKNKKNPKKRLQWNYSTLCLVEFSTDGEMAKKKKGKKKKGKKRESSIVLFFFCIRTFLVILRVQRLVPQCIFSETITKEHASPCAITLDACIKTAISITMFIIELSGFI